MPLRHVTHPETNRVAGPGQPGRLRRRTTVAARLCAVLAVLGSMFIVSPARAAPQLTAASWLPRGVKQPSRARLTAAEAEAPAPDDVALGTAGRSGRWVDVYIGESTEGADTSAPLVTAPPSSAPSDAARSPYFGAPALPPTMGMAGRGNEAAWSTVFGAPRPTLRSGTSFRAPTGSFAITAAGLAPEDPEANLEEEEELIAQPGEGEEETVSAGSVELSRRGVPPFFIERQYDTHRTRAVAFPPLFIHRTPNADHPEKFFHASLGFTFGWYAKKTKRRHYLSTLGFYGYFSERKTVWGAAPLLMGYRRVGEQFNFGQFPLVWWWGTKFVKNFLVVPFHYQQRAPESFRAVSGLIAWYGNSNLHDADLTNDRRYLVVAPVFSRFQRGLRRFDISPLYIGGANKLTGFRHKTVLPLFHWQSREFGNRKELWTLPWIRRTDKARRRSSWAVAPALTFRSTTPERDILSITPLVWRSRNKLRGSQLWLAGPVGRYTDPRQRNTVAAPLWWQFTDTRADKSTAVLFPLAIARRNADRLRVYTLLGGGGRTQNGWSMAAPPILTFAGRTDRGVRYQGVGGLLWHVRQPDEDGVRGRDDWVAGPLGYFGRDADGGRLGVVPALSFFKWGGTRRYQVLTPLLWHVRDTDPANPSRTIVAGPLYRRATGVTGQRQIDGGIVPLMFYGRGARWKYGAIPLLLSAHVENVQEQQALTISPLFVRSKSKDSRTLGVLGVAWDVKRPDERHSLLLPLYYRRNIGDRTLTVTPVGGRYAKGDQVTSVWGPYVRRRREGRDIRGVWPLVFVDRHQTPEGEARNLVIPPLVIRHRAPNDDLDMWTPLVWRTQYRGERARKGLAVVPLYFRQRQPGGVDVDAGLGYFWSRDRTRQTHTLIAGPGFHRLSRKGLHAGVAPLYWWMDSKEKRRLIALPLTIHLVDKKADSHTTVSIPFWFDRKQANGRRAWGAFPFVFGTRRQSSFTRFSLAPPGYLDIFRLRKNSRFTGYAPILFRYQKCGFRAEDDSRCQYTLWGSAPLFLYGRDGNGRRTHGSLVYYWDKRPSGYRLFTPLFGVTNEPGKTLAWYGGPIGMRTTNTWKRFFAFPLYYRKAHRLEDRSFTLAVPPLFISRVRKDQRFFEAGLLVWQFRQPHRVATAVVPPIFFHSHAFAERRLTWLAPIFLRDNNWGKDQTWTAIGPALYVQRRKGKNLDFVQFPLVWHIERGHRKGTFGAFVWWDFRTKKRNTFQMVPGAYTRWATPERDLKVIGPGLGWWIKGKGPLEGDKHWRALFGLFGGGIEGGQRYFALFGAKLGGAAQGPKGKGSVGGSTSRREQRALRRAARKAARAARRSERRLERTAQQMKRATRRAARGTAQATAAR